MDVLSFMHVDVESQATECNVYRGHDGYGGSGPSNVDTVHVAIFAPTTSSQVVVEGSGEDTSLTGLVVPEYDANGNLVEQVQVNDELRVASNEVKRYDVRVKDGVPNELDPEIWQLGLDRANASE